MRRQSDELLFNLVNFKLEVENSEFIIIKIKKSIFVLFSTFVLSG